MICYENKLQNKFRCANTFVHHSLIHSRVKHLILDIYEISFRMIMRDIIGTFILP